MSKQSAIVIGAGIVGMATARALAIQGYAVKVFDRSVQAVGASIRNFGMIWPIGQPSGELYQRAIRSREIWQEVVAHFDPVGSLHLAYHADEWQVLQELYEQFRSYRKVELLTPQQVLLRSEAVEPANLYGGLFSAEEAIVNPVEAIRALPAYLKERYDIEFCLGQTVVHVNPSKADITFICSGADFETLYPEIFNSLPITRCKLQMLRFAAQPEGWRIGPALCGGLSLIHYKSFSAAPSLSALHRRYEEELPDYLRWGIHVMVSQNNHHELTVGDSHEYGLHPEPFDKAFINEMILSYLNTFARFKDFSIKETWHGIYPKLTNGESHVFLSPEPGVYILNGLGGAGMTLSFGLAEEVVNSLCRK